jgi:hypothetical protein
MSSLSERTQGLAARMPSDRGREQQQVVLLLVDGTEVRGNLHRAQGSRTLDFLNRQSEGFVAMTDAELVHGQQVERVAFVALNKAHIVRLIEAVEGD